MHTIAPAIAEILAVGTLAGAHPLSMAIGRIAVLPYLHEVILVDIALSVVGTNTGTGTNGTVSHHGTYCHTSLTREETIAHFALIVAEESLATIVYTDASLRPNLLDIVKHPTKLLICQLHHRV